MKVSKNAEHNSIELDFEGAKPSEQLRTLIKAYGFWWFGKGKVWCHNLDGLDESDVEFFNEFVETRVKPLAAAPAAAVAPTADAVAAAAASLSEEDKQKLLASLMK